MSFTPIDLSKLPAPNIVEEIDSKTILSQMVNDLRRRDPGFTALVESDPAWKILEVAAYREMLVRQRVNDAARGVMLAFAAGSDLDQTGALFGVARKIITPADPDAVPPREAIMENDRDFRFRITLALEGQSTAGPEGSYLYHALKCPSVKDASIVGPPIVSPGQVLVTILGHSKDGTVSEQIIEEVKLLLNAEHVRPITDEVIVRAARIQYYSIHATLFTYDGPDPSVIVDRARKNVEQFVLENHRVGRAIPLSGIYAALHIEGVQRVELKDPKETLKLDHTQAPYCSNDGISISHGGVSR